MPHAAFDPHLSEADARALAGHVVERLRALHANPTSMGVQLMQAGFYFTATLHGRMVTVRTGQQGNVRYDDIAKELVLLALRPTDRGLDIDTITTPTGRTV